MASSGIRFLISFLWASVLLRLQLIRLIPWIGLAGDVVDLIPFVTGVGETVKTVAVVANTADTIADVHKAAKAVDQVDDVVDAAKAVYKAADKTSDIRKATGSYEILYESGKNYVGKGGFKRAINSAERLAKKYGDEVTSIAWKSSPNTKAAFLDEYYRMISRGIDNASTYNKIWSPGRRHHIKALEYLF